MRTVTSPTRWAGSILAALANLAALAIPAALAVASAAHAQDAEPAEVEPADAEQAEIEAALAEDAPHCAGTGVEGVVRDAQTQETLIEAPVIVVGRGRRTLTDYDGRFAIDLPPGTYSLRSYYDLYQPTRVDDVVVRRGECTRLDLELATESTTGEEVVIEVRAEAGTAASQLRVRRESAAVQDSISSEEMRRAPDSTASDAARRAVGVTTRDDYLYVSGLGGRYVATLMNGVALPQTDPDVPGVQLDIFPAGLLESLTIRKTFTPEMPGDWAGGLLDITTQSFPSDFELRAGVSLGANTGTTFQYQRGGRAGGLDWLGLDDGSRALPGAVRDTTVNLEELDEPTRDQLSQQFPNDWLLGSHVALPNMGLSLAAGDTVEVDGHLVGYRLMFGYRRTERPIPDFIQSLRVVGEGEDRQVEVRESLTQDGSQILSQWSALATITTEIAAGHQLTLNGLFSQSADDFTGRVRGRSESFGGDIDAYRMSWVQRSLAFGQLLGEHRALPGGARLDWQLNLSWGDRRQPSMRDITYLVRDDGSIRFAPSASSGARLYSGLEDITYGGGANLTIPIDRLTVRAGGLVRRSERAFAARRFGWTQRRRSPPEGLLLPPEQLFDATNRATYLSLQDYTRDDDGYDASQASYGAYASLEWRPVDEVRLLAGSRVEAFRQVVESATPYGAGETEPRSTYRTDLDPMPSISGAIEVLPSMFVRASYAGTVARPQVRELAPFLFIDFVRRRTVTGNPDLQRTYVHNLDLRWEWFPTEGSVLAVSGFGKLFESPIEPTIVTDEGDITYRNIDGAENYGLELEARMDLGVFASDLHWISMGGNFTYVASRAVLSPDQQRQATSSVRPLAGQPEWILNLSAGLEPPGTNLTVNVYYNVFGPRLEDVGVNFNPDVYREPFHALDVTVAWDPEPGFGLRLSATNVLFQRQELRQGGLVIQGFDPGTTFTLGASFGTD